MLKPVNGGKDDSIIDYTFWEETSFLDHSMFWGCCGTGVYVAVQLVTPLGALLCSVKMAVASGGFFFSFHNACFAIHCNLSSSWFSFRRKITRHYLM